jgi:F-type H+-transporting ATPase subunit epsilon
MHLTILTPEKTVFEGEADSLQLPGSLGLMGVLNRHAPILSGMLPGVCKFLFAGATQRFFVSGGFFEFNANKAVILADAVEEPGEIDLERAKSAADRARGRLKKKKDIDVQRAQRALFRALARQKAARI